MFNYTNKAELEIIFDFIKEIIRDDYIVILKEYLRMFFLNNCFLFVERSCLYKMNFVK